MSSRPSLPYAIEPDTSSYCHSIQQKKPGWTATNVMRVYIEAASQAHERLNVLTEIIFADALKKAKELDDEFEKTGKVTGICKSRPRSHAAAVPCF